MVTYKAVIFDFFGVICSRIAFDWLEHYAPAETRREIRKECIDPADVGTMTSDELFSRIGSRFNVPATQVRREWTEGAALDPRVISLIEQIKKEHRTALCTNAFADFLRPILISHDIEKIFDVVVISSEEGCAKPDHRMFEITLDRLGVTAQEALFVDDNQFNVAAAQGVGLTAIQYISPEQLSDELVHYGVLAR